MTIALLIEDTLLDMGLGIVGPVASLDAALHLAGTATLDAAILDINIRGGNSYAVADILADRQIPFVFCSGYSDWALEERHRNRPRLAKPYSPADLEVQLRQLLNLPPN